MRFIQCAAVVVAVLAACKGNKSKLDEMGSPPPVASSGSGAVKLDEAPRLPPVTPKKLAPVINVLGVENVVPTAVVIELDALGGRSRWHGTPLLHGLLHY